MKKNLITQLFLTLLLTVVSGGVKADDVTVTPPMRDVNPVQGGLFTITCDGTNAKYTGKSIQIAKTTTGTITIASAKSGFYIKSVSATDGNTKVSAVTTSDGTASFDSSTGILTATPASSTLTELTLTVTTSSSGSAKFNSFTVEMANDSGDAVEALYNFTGASSGAFTYSSSGSPALATISTTTSSGAGVSSQRINFGNNKTVTIASASEKNIKWIRVICETKNPSFTVNAGNGTYSSSAESYNGDWTATTDTKSVTLKNSSGSTVYILGVIVGLEGDAVVPVDPVFSLTTGTDDLTVGSTSRIQVGTKGHLDGITLTDPATSNASVATVTAAGVITAVGAGTADITFTTPATAKYNAVTTTQRFSVNVVDAPLDLPEYTVSFNGSDAQSTPDYFSFTGKHNFNSKFTGATYAGITFTSGLKMEGDTRVNFTSTAKSTVTIVQSTWSDKTIKLDDTELAIASATTGTGYRVYTITDVAAGAHSIARVSSESGLFYVSVQYTELPKEQLAAPAITFDPATAEVTIGSVAHATAVKYTTDGSEPADDHGTDYTAPFTVADGTVVKAIAIGNGTTYTDSPVATETVLLTGIKIATPTIKQLNGSVYLATTSPNATIKYSIDGGAEQTYTRTITLTSDASIVAYATRTGCTNSDPANADITAVPTVANVSTVWLNYDSFGAPATNGDGYSQLTGQGEAEGYNLILMNASKSWSSGNSIKNGEDASMKTIKGSNGAQVKLQLPAGTVARRLFIYSYVNNATVADACGWKEFNGSSVAYTNVPMGAFTDVADYADVPDVRVFPLDGTETEITFNNAGRQLCFLLGIEVESTPDVTLSGTATGTANADLVAANVGTANVTVERSLSTDYWNSLYLPFAMTAAQIEEAFGAGTVVATLTDYSDDVFKFETVSAIEAYKGYIIVPGTAVATAFTVEEATLVAAPAPSAPATTYITGLIDGKTFTAEEAADVYYITTTKKVNSLKTDGTGALKALRAYLKVVSGGSAKPVAFSVDGDMQGDVTAIDGVQAIAPAQQAPAYNVAGQRVNDSYRGIVIVNGKKVKR